MEPVIIAICVIAAIWAITKTGMAIRTLRAQRRLSGGGERRGVGYGVGGIDPGNSSVVGYDGHGHGGHGHGGGDCGGHGGDW